MPPRFAFVTGRRAFADGSTAWTDAGLGRLIDALRASHAELRVAASRAPVRRELDDHALSTPAADMTWLPWFPSTARSIHKHHASHEALVQLERDCDVLIVQLPFPAPSALYNAKKARVYHVCADVRAAIVAAHRTGLRAGIERGVGWAIWRFERALVHHQRAHVVTNGQEMLRQFGAARGRAVVSSTLHEGELESAHRSRHDDRFVVLYVGYLRRAKGIEVLLAAFERLLESHPNAELQVVGAADSGESSAIQAAIARLDSRRAVKMLGARAFGPALFQCYSDADVLVLPTLSEGTPRVLIEARAFGCPIIASRVGGIPTSVEDGVDGLLVPPGDANALSAALMCVASDAELRHRLSTAGLARVRQYTVEAFARSILEEATAAYEARSAH